MTDSEAITPWLEAHATAWLEQTLGFSAASAPVDELRPLLAERLLALGMRDGHAWAAALGDPLRALEERRAFAKKLAVGETYFFRDADQIDMLLSHVLPARAAAKQTAALRVLSVGCSSGEEPYSFAMALEQSAGPGPRAQIRGIDVNPRAVEAARAASYSAWSLRATPGELRARYFREQGGRYHLAPAIAESVQFEEASLFDADLDKQGAFDLVLCRNVLIYFSEPQIVHALGRLARLVAEGGSLCLGHADPSRQGIEGFELGPGGGLSHLVRTRAPADTRAGPPRRAMPRLEPPGIGRSRQEATDASKRPIAAGWSPGRSPPVAAPGKGGEAIERAVRAFRRERFDEARAALQDAPPGDGDLELLRANVAFNLGDLAETERACGAVLRADPHAAAAHYLLGLCDESRGQDRLALEHHLGAVRIDPGFSLAVLRVGILARRLGDLVRAGESLLSARVLLALEDEEMFRSFGGGFGREVLLGLCRAELEKLGCGR